MFAKEEQGQLRAHSVTESTRRGYLLLEGVPTLEDSSLGVLLPRGSLVPSPPPLILWQRTGWLVLTHPEAALACLSLHFPICKRG